MEHVRGTGGPGEGVPVADELLTAALDGVLLPVADTLAVPAAVAELHAEHVGLPVLVPVTDVLEAAAEELARVAVAAGEPVPVPETLGAAVPLLDGTVMTVAVDDSDGVGVESGAGRHGSATPPVEKDEGTAVWPLEFLPQQATAPPADRAHVCSYPAATATWPPPATLPGTAV